MALYKVTGYPSDADGILAVIVNAPNLNAALGLATSDEVMPGHTVALRTERERWAVSSEIECVGSSYPADRPAGVLAVERAPRA